MYKGTLQMALIGTAIIGTAFVEAVLPIWMAESISNPIHITSKSDEGTMQGWSKCMAKDWPTHGDSLHQTQHDACSNAVAVATNGVLAINAVKLDDGTYCQSPPSDHTRSVSGVISNTSTYTYMTRAIWYGTYPTKPVSTRGYGLTTELWLAPGESITTCLFTLKFKSAQQAEMFDAQPYALKTTMTFERGILEESINTHATYASR